MKESRIKRLEHQLESHQTAEAVILVQQEYLEAAKAELAQTNKDCADKTALMEQEIETHKQEKLELEENIQQLQTDKKKLERDNGNVLPLVLIGAAIRRRFLERAAKKLIVGTFSTVNTFQTRI